MYTRMHARTHARTHLICLELCFVNVCGEELGQLLTAGERAQVHHRTRLDTREEVFDDATFLALVLSVVSTGGCQRLSGLLAPFSTLQAIEKACLLQFALYISFAY